MRNKLIDQLDEIYQKVCEAGYEDRAEEILTNNNASSNDSDPDEGFMVTMSDKDLKNAIAELAHVAEMINPDSLQAMIHAVQSGIHDNISDDYAEGFLDACKMFVDEYHIELDGLED